MNTILKKTTIKQFLLSLTLRKGSCHLKTSAAALKICAEERTGGEPWLAMSPAAGGSTSEHKPSPASPSPHLKFQNNEHFTQKGKFSALTHGIIPFCLLDTPTNFAWGARGIRQEPQAGDKRCCCTEHSWKTHPELPWSLPRAQGQSLSMPSGRFSQLDGELEAHRT